MYAIRSYYDLAEARESLERALEIDDSHTRSRYLLAGILAATGEKEKAERLYERVLSDDPGTEEAYLHLSTLYAERGDYA